jgi:prepilin-type N-terminal cleavage/methylation domain-containing protein
MEARITPGRQAGFTFNEVLVAMSVVVLMVMGYALSSGNMIRRQAVNSHSTVAIHLAQDKIEELQAQRILSDNDLCPDMGDHGIGANGVAPGLFDRCWRIVASAYGPHLKQIDVRVSWEDREIHSVTLSTLAFRGQ